MTKMKSVIPIFSLNLVIYPEAIYPLHIFEERYKRLIYRCRTDGIGFGIVSKIDTKISTIGCYVELIEVVNVYENGNLDILVKGKERFQTISTQLHTHGYLEANIVPYIDDRQYLYSEPIEFETINIFKDIIDRTAIEFDEKYWMNFERSKLKSYKIAEKAGMNLNQQQNFLTLRSESDRLKFLLKHFQKLEGYLERTTILKEIIAGDGFIN